MNAPLRVLWVDESPAEEGRCSRVLAAQPGAFTLAIASDRAQFEALLENGRWDMVVSDFHVLGYDSLQIIDVVRQRDPRIAVVILTRRGSEGLAVEAIKRGATDYVVSTPEQLPQLPATLQAALARQRRMMSASELEAVLETSGDGIVVLSNTGQIIHRNARIMEMWNIPAGRFVDQDFRALQAFVSDQLLESQEFFERSRAAFDADERTFDVLHFKDGRVVERRTEPQMLAGVKIGRVISYRDISPVVMAQQKLKTSLALQVATLNATADGILVVDRRRRVVGANRKFQELWGIPDEMLAAGDDARLLSHVIDQLVDPATSMRLVEELYDRAGETSHDILLFKDGRVFDRYSQPQFVDGEPAGRVWSFRDITERQREERTQRALREISEAAQSTHTLNDLFQRIHQAISGLLPAKNFLVAIYDEASGKISFPYYVDEFDPNPGVVSIAEDSMTGRVIENGKALLFTPTSVNDEARDDVPLVGTESMDWLGVPLKSKDGTIGALVVQSYEGSVRYTVRDKELLEFVCGQIATAIERKQAEASLRESEAQMEEAQRLAHLGSWAWHIDRHQLSWSDEMCRIYGLNPATHVPSIRDLFSRVHPQDRATTEALLLKARSEKVPVSAEVRIVRDSGEIRTLDAQAEVRLDEQGRVTGLVGICLDITERKREELLEHDRRLILEQVAKNEPLPGILARIVRMLESRLVGSRCGIMMLQQGRLYAASAPSLPLEYSQVIEGMSIGPAVGSCGTACYGHERVIVEDIACDPLWEGYRELALSHGLRACWSSPIDGDGGLLGTFAVYYGTPRRPSAAELDFIDAAVRLASLAIEHRRLTDQLSHQGQHDALTGLPNRLLLQDRLEQALSLAVRKQQQVAVLFMDLDRFKQINDTLGHSHGDTLLREVARRLSACVRKSDTLARLGGDEFMAVLPELNDAQDAMRVAGKFMEALRAPFQVAEHEFFISVSLGISIYPADGLDGSTLMANADAAMYRAKETGRDNCMWFTPQMNARMLERVELERQLRHAQSSGQLSLHYQPQCGAHGEILGFEALLRWKHPTLGMIPPARFIPLAEESGLIVPIGEWVLHEACRCMAAWRRAGHADLSISVNVSAIQFRRGNLLDTVRRVLAETRLEPQALVLEITESLLLQNAAEASAHLVALRELGVGVAIDDFGTGYSSLSYLHKLPVTSLKIDQSFVCEIGMNRTKGSDEAPIIRTIIALARNLGLSVVAEGVETHAQHQLLLALGCDGFQGYLLHPPLPSDEAEALLQAGRGILAADVPTWSLAR